MKIPDFAKDFANVVKKLIGLMPKFNIEKLVFKTMLGVWVFVIFTVIILRIFLGARDDVERRITEAATDMKLPITKKSEIANYESFLNLVKYPEGIEEYTGGIKRDPFSEYKEELAIQPLAGIGHDFVLKSIDRVQLPLVYKGYIELPDTIIGQINWQDTTRFVKIGSILNGYRIHSITKEKIEAIDEEARKVKFELNKPVFSNELHAVLYDNISKKTFSVRARSEIDEYKVIKIEPDYVILLTKETEIRLE